MGAASVDEPQQEERNIYIMPLFIQILWSFIFGAMVFVAAGGNIIVIWIVLTHKRMASVLTIVFDNCAAGPISSESTYLVDKIHMHRLINRASLD